MPSTIPSQSLTEIGAEHKSDKFVSHSFTGPYENHFAPLRDAKIRILEIGIGEENHALGGASLLTWKDYFPNAEIFGLDLYDKTALDQDRITTIIGDQSDAALMREISQKYGPFDIIIDDGSHIASHTTSSLFSLYPLLNDGGWYVVEDIQTSYWANYGGSSFAPACYDTAIRWIKFFVDIINKSEILDPAYFPLSSGFEASELHVYHNIAFIRKPSSREDAFSRVLTQGDLRDKYTGNDWLKNGRRQAIHQALIGNPGLFGEIIDIIAEAGSVQQFIRQRKHVDPS